MLANCFDFLILLTPQRGKRKERKLTAIVKTLTFNDSLESLCPISQKKSQEAAWNYLAKTT